MVTNIFYAGLKESISEFSAMWMQIIKHKK